MITASMFDELSTRFTLIPLNINCIQEKTPDNGEILADFATGEMSIAVVNENTGEIIGIINPFTKFRQEDQRLAQSIVQMKEEHNEVYAFTAVVIEELQTTTKDSFTRTNNRVANIAASLAMSE